MRNIYLKIGVSIILACAISSCYEGQKEQNPSAGQVANTGSPLVASIPTNLSVEGDTINVVGKHILFFGPSTSIIKDRNVDKGSLESFNLVAQSLIDSIESITSQAKASMTTVGHVRIYGSPQSAPKMIILSTFSEPYGMIISDGTNLTPIIKGIRTRDDYEKQIRKTLNFENL